MRILEVIQKTTPYFEKQGIESPRLTIELLLAHLLKKKRMDLYLEFDRPLGMVSVRDALDEDLYDLRIDLAQRASTE